MVTPSALSVISVFDPGSQIYSIEFLLSVHILIIGGRLQSNVESLSALGIKGGIVVATATFQLEAALLSCIIGDVYQGGRVLVSFSFYLLAE